MSWVLFLLIGAMLLFVARGLVPRRIIPRQDGRRLVLTSPLLGRLLADLRLVFWVGMCAFFLVLFAISREWLVAGLFLLILLRFSWQMYRNAIRGTLVVDQAQNTISVGPRVVGQVSELVALQVDAQDAQSVVLVLRDDGRQDRGVLVRGADRTDGQTISLALAELLHIPIVEAR